MKNNNLISFMFGTINVRMVKEANELETVWFVAKDIAKILGYVDPKQAVRDLCKGQRYFETLRKGVCQTPLVHPRTLMVRLPDVFRLIMRSKLPSAERFQDWVVEEVLPQIYHYGAYKYLSRRAEQDSRRQAALEGARGT